MDRQLLVLGGGVAGLSASQSAAAAGMPVVLVEKEKKLGGFAAQFCCKATDTCAYCSACIADETLREVSENPSINVHLGTSLESVVRQNGGFTAKLSSGKKIEASAVIVACGFEPFDPLAARSATALCDHPGIMSAIEVESMLREKGGILNPLTQAPPGKVAFIQCVGSRSRRFGSPECSRVCCPYAIRIARRLKWRRPDCEIALFHMDLQGIRKVALDMYGQFANEIEFIRSIPAEALKGPKGELLLKYEDSGSGRIVKREFDLVVLSVGIAPRSDAGLLCELLGVKRNAVGFLESPSMSEPHISDAEGVFLAGACTGPKDIKESAAQGRAAALAALNWIQGKDA
jgi:heterodisulfide reductase subunit A